jgi:K+-transporting ATPase KdpF subunit
MRLPMGLDYSIGLLVSIAMLVYLVVAMVKPEKF